MSSVVSRRSTRREEVLSSPPSKAGYRSPLKRSPPKHQPIPEPAVQPLRRSIPDSDTSLASYRRSIVPQKPKHEELRLKHEMALEEIEHENIQKTGEIDRLKDSNARLNESQYGMKHQLDTLRSQIQDLEFKSQRDIDKTREQWESKIISQDSQLTQEVHFRQKLEAEIESANVTRYKLEETLVSQQKRNDELQSDLVTKNREIGARIDELDRQKHDKEKLKAEIANLDRTNSEIEQKYQREIDNVKRLENVIRNFEAKQSNRDLEANKLIDDLERERTGLQQALEKAQASNSGLNSQLNEALRDADRAKRHVQEIESEKDVAQRQRDDANNALNAANDKTLGIEEDKRRLTVVITDLERTNHTLRTEHDQLNHDLAGLQAKNSKLFAALEKALQDKARDYKEKTSYALSGRGSTLSPSHPNNRTPQRFGGAASPNQLMSPSRPQNRTPLRSVVATPQVKSPVLDSYFKRRQLSQTVLDENATPFRSPFGSPQRIELNPSTAVSPDRSRGSMNKSREGLTPTHQRRIAKSASHLASELREPVEHHSPLKYIKNGGNSPPRNDTVMNLRANLAGIKNTLSNLQQSKAAIEGKMNDFERKMRLVDDPRA